MRKIAIVFALLAFGMSTHFVASVEAAKAQVLIVTGDDVGPHPWKEVSQATRDLLVASGKFDVVISEKASVLETAADLKKYDVIYLAMYNAKTPTLTDAAKQNLLDFVKSGKGFVASHLASGSFKEWDEFKKLCGRNWVFGKGKSGHGPRSVFKCKVTNKDHAITKGLADFEADDELYAKMEQSVPVNVLVTADSDWSKQTEPLAFTLEYGKGRVFHHTFGHDGKALNNPAIQKLLQNGTQWAATGKVE